MAFVLSYPFSVCKGQNELFVGRITYESELIAESETPFVKAVRAISGDKSVEYFDGKNFRIDNESPSLWKVQWYFRDEGRTYYLEPSADTLFWIDVTKSDHRILSYSIDEDGGKIAGYDCKVLSLVTNDIPVKYYFAPALRTARDAFSTYQVTCRDSTNRIMQSLSLRWEGEFKEYKVITTATKVKRMRRIPKRKMRLPKNLPVVEYKR